MIDGAQHAEHPPFLVAPPSFDHTVAHNQKRPANRVGRIATERDELIGKNCRHDDLRGVQQGQLYRCERVADVNWITRTAKFQTVSRLAS